jgi:hypothetical protein
MLDKKITYVIDKYTLEIEYVIVDERMFDDKVTLMKSQSEGWSESVKNTEVLSIKDTGEGYKIKWSEKPGKVLDYMQTVELTILLNYINKESRIPCSYDMVKVEDLTQLM